MQLTLRVNNGNTVTGAVGGKGVLGVSITVFAPAAGNEPTGKAVIRAFESSKVSEWRADDLSIGDKVEIHLRRMAKPTHLLLPCKAPMRPCSSSPIQATLEMCWQHSTFAMSSFREFFGRRNMLNHTMRL